MKRWLLMSALMGAACSGNAQLQVTSDTTALNLANLLVGTGTNVQNATLTCGAAGAGSFTNGGSTNLGISDGIVLSSGMVDSIPGVGFKLLSSNNNAAGDPYLDTISAFPTFDGCVLEFDVTVAGPLLSMNYVFASEEYPSFVCSGFNDAFAFQISGPNPLGGSYANKNIALVPGSANTVSINTINGGTGTGSPNCILTNAALYVDNANGTDIAFNGFTIPLTATIATVPGQTYHMRYAVADASDFIMDTGVFLEAGSLKSLTTASIPEALKQQLAAFFPNPAEGVLNVRNKDGKGDIHVTLCNMMGQQVLKQTIAAGQTVQINLNGLVKGMYTAIISSGNQTEVQRIAVN